MAAKFLVRGMSGDLVNLSHRVAKAGQDYENPLQKASKHGVHHQVLNLSLEGVVHISETEEEEKTPPDEWQIQWGSGWEWPQQQQQQQKVRQTTEDVPALADSDQPYEEQPVKRKTKNPRGRARQKRWFASQNVQEELAPRAIAAADGATTAAKQNEQEEFAPIAAADGTTAAAVPLGIGDGVTGSAEEQPVKQQRPGKRARARHMSRLANAMCSRGCLLYTSPSPRDS